MPTRTSLFNIVYLPVALYAAVVLLPLLDNGTVLSRHEVLAAEPAREMLAGTGSWAVQTFGGQFRTAKPPTMSWLIAASMTLLQSQGEFAARLPAALAGIGTAIGTAAIAFALSRRAALALLSGLIMVTMYWVQMQARLAEADMPLVLAVTLAMLAICPRHGEETATSKQVLLRSLLFYGATGAGFLLKGVGPLVTLPAAIVFAAWAGDRTTWRVLRHPAGIGLFVLLLIAWPLAAYQTNPSILHDWRRQTVDRSLGRMDEADRGAIGPLQYLIDLPFYLWMTPLLLLPATPAVGIGLHAAWKRGLWSPLPVHRERARVRADKQTVALDQTALTLTLSHEYAGEGTGTRLTDRVAKFLLAWVLPFTLLLSLSAWKHKHYILPVLPAFSILAAYGTLVWAASLPRPQRARQLLIAWFAGVAIVLLIVQAFVLPKYDEYRAHAELAWQANKVLPPGEHAVLLGLGEAHVAYYLTAIPTRIDDVTKVPTGKLLYGICTQKMADRLAETQPVRTLAVARARKKEAETDRLVLVQLN